MKLRVIFFAFVLTIAIFIILHFSSDTIAAPGLEEGCGNYHTSSIICDDCTQCYIPNTTYYLGRVISMDHQDLSLGFVIPPATTTLDSCDVTECHNTNDARFVTLTNSSHEYCERDSCHDTGPGPTCDTNLCHPPSP